MHNLAHLKRLRWGVLAVVVVGIAGSVTLNALHAPDNVVARIIAGAPPLAVFFTIELISRIPSSNGWLSAGRILGSVIVAGVGGSISYVQQMNYVRELGFASWEATVWPACVDGLMMVATLSLVEVVRKIRQVTDAVETVTPATAPARLRAAIDLHEDENALAFRRAQAELRSTSSVPSLNGKAV